MNQIKNVIFIQILNSFVSGILYVVLPLLMLERNIDIVSIGLIYASLPMVFQLTRVGFAVISDLIGRKLFFILNGILSALYITVYYFAYTPLEFLFGKISEAINGASVWSVNRAFILEQSKKKWKSLARFRSFARIFSAIGILVAGFLVTLIFYSSTLVICILISILIIPAALAIIEKKKGKFRIEKAFDNLDLRKRGVTFKKVLIFFLLLGLSFGLIAGYVFPLFLIENKFNPEIIGALLGIQIFLSGLSLYFSIGKFSFEKIILYGGLFYSIILFLIGFTSSLLAIAFFLIFGIADGVMINVQEGIYSKVTKDGTYATDIGLLLIGFHGGRTITLALSGFLITFYGFSFLFSLSALIFVFCFSYAYYIFREKK